VNLGLEGKSALIFGASKGIGAATARVFSEEGAHVALTGRTPPEELAQQLGGLALAADLTQAGDAERAIAAVVGARGRLDVLVISAGAAQGGIFWDLDDAVWEEAMALKYMGMVRAVRAAAGVMREQRAGRIIAVVGNLGRQPAKRLMPGSAANAACLAFIRGAAEELAEHDVQITAINPGPTRTDRWSTLIGNLARASGRPAAEIEAEQLAAMPSGRIAEAHEVARMIAVLASEFAGHMTGTSLTIDGGMTKGIA
jgi:NAD(P)-dependent dehydrogenase (short-subunit alcohol dehydrogenase family)